MDQAYQQACHLLCFLTKRELHELSFTSTETRLGDQSDSYQALLKRRGQGEPLEYLIGTVAFYNMTLKVTPAVLIPRPETEELVELIKNRIKGEPPRKIVDLGTGSGCIALSLSRLFPTAQVLALDVSERALDCARENRKLCGLEGRVELARFDMLQTKDWSFLQEKIGFCDLVVSNPPYVDFAREASLIGPDTWIYEPKLAFRWRPPRTGVLSQSLQASAFSSLKKRGLYRRDWISARTCYQDSLSESSMATGSNLFGSQPKEIVL